MEEQVKRLVTKLQGKAESHPRYLVAIAGIPGSGKTTLATVVVSQLNATTPGIATYVPLDGFHYSRAQLDQFPDPANAHARRGAAFTFDSPAFLGLVQQIHLQSPQSPPVYAPSFDHALKDPVHGDIPILATSKVIVFEGLYLHSSKSPWRDAAKRMNELWFVDVDFETAQRRLVKRHVQTGVAGSVEEATQRASGSDAMNRDEIVAERLKSVDETVISREDDDWKTN